MSGIPIQVCDACGHAVFPERALCPVCGSPEHHLAACRTGLVEQVTTHRGGGAVASVATELGPVVIARLSGDAAGGSRVELELVEGGPVATPERPAYPAVSA